jgi:hypothetical protein
LELGFKPRFVGLTTLDCKAEEQFSAAVRSRDVDLRAGGGRRVGALTGFRGEEGAQARKV